MNRLAPSRITPVVLATLLGACAPSGAPMLDGPAAETSAEAIALRHQAPATSPLPSPTNFRFPGPDLTVEVAPVEDGAVVYKALAGADGRTAQTYKLVIGLRIRNQEPAFLTVDNVIVDFPGTTRPAITMLDVNVPLAPGGVTWWSSGNTASGNNAMYLDGPMPRSVRIRIGAAGWIGLFEVTMPLRRHVHPVAESAYRLPFAAGELRPSEYYQTRAEHWANGGGQGLQINAYDIGAVGWSAQNGWSEQLPGTTGAANDDYRIWERPYRAMADGTVVAFNDGMPDNTVLGSLPEPTPDPAGGNFLQIRHGDEIVTYAHFKNGTIPAALLQVNAQVSEGQYLGLVGNSGNSPWPHVHIAVSSDNMRLRPFAFRDAWGIDAGLVAAGQISGGWFPLRNHGPSLAPMLLWPASTTPNEVMAVAGIARSGSWASRLFIRSSQSSFEQEAQRLFDDEGKRLVWVTTYIEGGQRKWVGIADSGTWASRFWVSSSRAAFDRTAQTLFNRNGLRLTHVHTFVENGQTRFVGLARSGTWANRIISRTSRAAFEQAAQDAFTKDGLRLVHVHSYLDGGQRVWMGIARSGTWANRLFFASSRSAFEATAQSLFDNEGKRLTHLHTYEENGARRWVGIARSGNWANRLHVNPDVESHVLDVQRLFDQQGKRPTLFEPLGPR